MTKSINGKAVALQLEEERKKSRIAVTEKYRPIYERQAKDNLITAGKNYGVGKEEKPLPNLVNPISNLDTTKKLAEMAGVGKETYRMGAKVLSSEDEDVKQRVDCPPK